MADTVEHVAVVGLGTLGSQIALQTAASGYTVSGYDPNPNALEQAMESFLTTQKSGSGPASERISSWAEAAGKIRSCASLSAAVQRADLVIEAVPENLELKLNVWREIDQAAPQTAILATNSSSMPVSKLEGVTRRSQRCLNIHFYQLVMGQNMADIMGGTQTTSDVIDAGRKYVRSIGVVPLAVNKELLGFCFNRVWRAVKREALHMWADGFVDFRDVDRAWAIFTGADWGPFALMDAVGLDVVWDIEMVYYQDSGDARDRPPEALREMIDAGNLGVKTRKGFYDYPDPEFQSDEFLRP